MLKRLDQNGDKKLDLLEFQEALQDYGIDVDKATQKACFQEMDRNGNGVVNFDEFLIALRVSVSLAPRHLCFKLLTNQTDTHNTLSNTIKQPQ